jgi:hypothetical protein
MYNHWQVAMNDDVVLLKQLDELKEEHRRLDAEIRLASGDLDEFTLAHKKKRKLQLRDLISTLEFEIYPDQPA